LKGYITAKVSIKSQKFYAPKFLIQAQQKFGRLPKLGILRHVHPSGKRTLETIRPNFQSTAFRCRQRENIFWGKKTTKRFQNLPKNANF
jgi:hypothetical protein